jgi:hypothetical protein
VAVFGELPRVDAAEVAAVGKTENAAVQFECNIHMHKACAIVGTLHQFLRVFEPEELAIEPEVERKQSAVENEEHVFAFAFDSTNAAALGETGYVGRSLRLSRDGVEYVNAPYALALNDRAERADYGFHLWQFRHGS